MAHYDKREILTRFDKYYISPLTRFYVEVEFLKRALMGRPQRIHISQPNSWRSLSLQKTSDLNDHQSVVDRLLLLESYLINASISPFSHEEPLQLGKSLPYFEGLLQQQLIGTHDLFGQKNVLYFYQGNEELLWSVLDSVREAGLQQSFYIIGIYTEALKRALQASNIPFIENISRHAFLNMNRNRGLTNFFNPQIDLILLDESGGYLKHFSRQDFLKQLPNIKSEYFPTISDDKILDRP